MKQDNIITIKVSTDENKMPEKITWQATGSTVPNEQLVKAAFVSLWDGTEKSALRIDLWTNEMMVDEMADFYFQTLMAMADTYKRATGDNALTGDMKDFAKVFYQKYKAKAKDTN